MPPRWPRTRRGRPGLGLSVMVIALAGRGLGTATPSTTGAPTVLAALGEA